MAERDREAGQPARVVVVGAGFAGRRLKLLLDAYGFDVVLVDAKGYFEYTPSALRCMVRKRTDPEFQENVPKLKRLAARRSVFLCGRWISGCTRPALVRRATATNWLTPAATLPHWLSASLSHR